MTEEYFHSVTELEHRQGGHPNEEFARDSWSAFYFGL
jgi:hypothetical protein